MQQVHEILWIHQQHLVAGEMVFGQLAEISCSERAAPKSSLIVLVASRVPRSGSLKKLLCFQFELQFSQFQCYLADEYFSWKEHLVQLPTSDQNNQKEVFGTIDHL